MKLTCLKISIILLCCMSVKAQEVVFVPQGNAQAQFAGYYAAQVKDYYAAEGVSVEIIHPTRSESAYSFLESGKAQFITLTLSQALHYKKNGADIVNVMQTSQVNSLMLVGHTPLNNPAALQNRRMGVWSNINVALVQSIMLKYGIKAQLIRYNGGVNAFLSKAVDVCLMGSYNEYPQLAECGYRVDSTHVMRLSDWGYDMPEDGVYVSRSFYEKNKELVRKFVEASKKGWEYAVKNEDEVVDITMEYIKSNRGATNRYHQLQMLREVLLLQRSPNTGKREYRLSSKSFESVLGFALLSSLKYDEFVK